MTDQIGLFGKIPAHGDFVRINAASAVVRAFDAWLQRCLETLQSANRAPPARAVNFLFRDESADEAMLGAFAPSRDQVGRYYPLVVFTTIPAIGAASTFPSVPTAHTHFLAAAARLLAEASTYDAPTLAEEIQTFPVGRSQEVEAARHINLQALAQMPAAVLLERLFGDPTRGVRYHGFNMFGTACSRVRGQDPGKASIVLDCPVSSDVELLFWLELGRMMLGWTAAPPAFFWSTDGRLLLALGAPGTSILHYLSDPSHTADRLWPMTTESDAAIEAGRSALSPTQLAVLDGGDHTVGQLLAALTS